jgi:hypothetical protein
LRVVANPQPSRQTPDVALALKKAVSYRERCGTDRIVYALEGLGGTAQSARQGDYLTLSTVYSAGLQRRFVVPGFDRDGP